MGILTDTDIKKLLGKEIVIEPFDDKHLTPVGYDLTVGQFVYSFKRGLLSPDEDFTYEIEPHEHVLVLSKEFVWISPKIGGTFHSKVSLVSQGFSHISTTLDPQWTGPLLIAIPNVSDRTLCLQEDQEFVTLVLYRTQSPATKPHHKPPARIDVIMNLARADWAKIKEEEFARKQQFLLDRVSKIVTGGEAQERFEEMVREANRQGFSKVLDATARMLRSRGRYYSLVFSHLLIIAALVTLPLWFDRVVTLFSLSISYDNRVFVAQLSGIVAAILSLLRVMRDHE
jgi:deoxycytidine triphosphate deaminase